MMEKNCVLHFLPLYKFKKLLGKDLADLSLSLHVSKGSRGVGTQLALLIQNLGFNEGS